MGVKRRISEARRQIKDDLNRRRIANFVKRAESEPTEMIEIMGLLAKRPDLTDRWGFHIRSHGLSEPFPDFASITPAQTMRRPALELAFVPAPQLNEMHRLAATYADELKALVPSAEGQTSELSNSWFSGLDAALYYAILRDLKPRRVIEVGGGYSTRMAARALASNRDEGRQSKLTSIEPFPQPRLLDAGLELELIEERVEALPLSTFADLGEGDVLFIDSSHVSRLGGDVNYLFLEVLPSLAPGVWVHIHDIFLPTDYPPRWLIERRLAFSEQYLLAAFLAFNGAYETQFGVRWLLLDFADQVHKMWPAEMPIDAGSLANSSYWIKRVR